MLNWLKHKILQHQHARGTHPGKIIAWVDSKPLAIAYCHCQATHHITPHDATLTDGTQAVVYPITEHHIAIVHMIEHQQTVTCTEAQLALMLNE